jgi:SAM-dependent methyltransferase
MKHCVICGNTATQTVCAAYPGYVERSSFEILSCSQCNTNFISPIEVDKGIYDLIYSNKNVPGYDRLFQQAGEIKSQKHPLQYLSENGSTYFAVHSFLSNHSGRTILEAGCGYGYLTYSLNTEGRKAVGVDLSGEAIDFAKKNFGSYFFNETIQSYRQKNHQKFDVIIATELIEHLSDPLGFLVECKEMLNDDGAILITTPNKNYFAPGSIWRTDLPPVHTLWLSKESFGSMAEQLKLGLKFVDIAGYHGKRDNMLFHYLITKKEQIPPHILTKDGQVTSVRNEIENSKFRKSIHYLMRNFRPVVSVSNFIYRMCGLNKECPQLAVVLTKK